MSERLIDKLNPPTESEIINIIGKDSYTALKKIEDALTCIFDLKIDLKYPFGENYGWGYKFSHKTKHLFYIFFLNGSLSLTTRISNPKTAEENELIQKLSSNGKKCWESKYPCGDGGWVHYDFSNCEGLHDAGIFISLRTGKDITLL
ncbi:MAG TPA: DUF3788 family protein [Treponemataceae bacterium]|jgi:hypothetical protein|nr:DUF3788 family protein [Treponemataceae bacterium]